MFVQMFFLCLTEDDILVLLPPTGRMQPYLLHTHFLALVMMSLSSRGACMGLFTEPRPIFGLQAMTRFQDGG